MSDTIIRWLHPLNWDGEYLEGQPSQGWKRMRVQFLYYDTSANGTDETHETKLVRADMKGGSGRPAYKIQIDRIQYATYGMNVRIYYDMQPDQFVFICPESDSGIVDGPWVQQIEEPGGYLAGETGDVVFSTGNASQYDYYNIILDITIIEPATMYL